MKFTKMQGLGNDYVYVNLFEEKVEDPVATAIAVSDRHFGIGSDGLILIGPSDVADFEMIMYNLDGSRGEMCGNGIRCVGKYVYDHGMTDKTEITVETLGGIKVLQLFVGDDGCVEQVRVDMGKPILESEKIPVNLPDPAISVPIEVDGKTWAVTCVSMGNPHAVVFVDDVDTLDLEKIGPPFENHLLFPNRINTEFIQIVDRSHVKMRVWERGSGETMACGTGACASTVACVLNDLTDRHLYLDLLGGRLDITWDEESGHVFMTGPAVTSFEGEW
ncbi:MAG: diaminopimelate epimerase [Lachnospiraceae bacterium]|nr:diaminopimelate epimerase [Lachnospiraceae bacterium]